MNFYITFSCIPCLKAPRETICFVVISEEVYVSLTDTETHDCVSRWKFGYGRVQCARREVEVLLDTPIEISPWFFAFK